MALWNKIIIVINVFINITIDCLPSVPRIPSVLFPLPLHRQLGLRASSSFFQMGTARLHWPSWDVGISCSDFGVHVLHNRSRSGCSTWPSAGRYTLRPHGHGSSVVLEGEAGVPQQID